MRAWAAWRAPGTRWECHGGGLAAPWGQHALPSVGPGKHSFGPRSENWHVRGSFPLLLCCFRPWKAGAVDLVFQKVRMGALRVLPWG